MSKSTDIPTIDSVIYGPITKGPANGRVFEESPWGKSFNPNGQPDPWGDVPADNRDQAE